jgi:hypothetical protein
VNAPCGGHTRGMSRSTRLSAVASSAVLAAAAAFAAPLLSDGQDGPAPNSSSAGAADTRGAAPAALEVRVDPADVATVDALLAAVYDVISGPAGEARDWPRFHGLFHPERGRMMATRAAREPVEGAPTRELVHLSPADYAARSGPVLEERGFFERQLAARVEHFGDIAHVFSTYEARTTLEGDVIARGINSFQLWWDGKRWWVLSILWCSESEEFPLEARHLEAPNFEAPAPDAPSAGDDAK